MHLTIGASLGPYEILGLLGTGGMGEVYRARDARLQRDVAIKVLPEDFASDPDRLRRFELEARAVAALNHPNILQIYDSGVQNGVAYMVTELLEGQSLRERMGGGALPARKAADIAFQIALGLAAAHEKGLIHRDLKPENLFISKDQRVRILDFGLAKQREMPSFPGSNPSEESTRALLSQPGVVVGTIGYMSPEQIRGDAVDARSDLFALGLILWEMLCGERPFRADSAVEVLHQILKAETPELPAELGLPPALSKVVDRLLRKEPASRFQSAQDLAFALENLPSSGTTLNAPLPMLSRRRWGMFAAGALLLIGLGAGTGWILKGRRAPRFPTFRPVHHPQGTIYGARYGPDRKSIYFAVVGRNPMGEAYVEDPNSSGSRPLGISMRKLLAISSRGEMVFDWQKDPSARSIAAKAFLSGGAPRPWRQEIVDLDWSPAGDKLALVAPSATQDVVEYPEGHAVAESSPGQTIVSLRFSPDGQSLAYIELPRDGSDKEFQICFLHISTGKKRIAGPFKGFTNGLAWDPGGKEIWSTGKIENEPGSVFTVAPNGAFQARANLPYASGLLDINAEGELLFADRDYIPGLLIRRPGSPVPAEISASGFTTVGDLSDDGREWVFNDLDPSPHPDVGIYLQTAEGGTPVHLGNGSGPRLSPDHQWVFASQYNWTKLVLIPRETGAERVLPLSGFTGLRPLGWFPDGRTLYFEGSEAGRPSRIYAMGVQDLKPRPLTPESKGGTGVGIIEGVLDSSGTRLLAEVSGGGYGIYSPDHPERPPEPVPGILKTEHPIRWTPDGKGIFVSLWKSAPVRIERIDVATGKREVVTTLTTPWGGAARIRRIKMSGDGKTLAYTALRIKSRLFTMRFPK